MSLAIPICISREALARRVTLNIYNKICEIKKLNRRRKEKKFSLVLIRATFFALSSSI